jgi:hypothetical protein
MTMPMHLKVIDEDFEIEEDFGDVNDIELSKIIDLAKKLDMSCLIFIDLNGVTYFSEKQCSRLKQELEIIKNHSETNTEAATKLQHAVNHVFSDGFLQLKIEKK